MSSTDYHRSRIFRVSSSIMLSTAFFVTAIGVWLVQSGSSNISADTVASSAACLSNPPTQSSVSFASGGTLSQFASTWKVTYNGTDTSSTAPNATTPTGYTIDLDRLQLEGANGSTILKIPTGTRPTGQLNFVGAYIIGSMQFKLISAKGEVATVQYSGGKPLDAATYTMYTPQGTRITGTNLIQYLTSSGTFQNMPTSTMPLGSTTFSPSDSFTLSWDTGGFSFAGGANASYPDPSKVGPITEIQILPVASKYEVGSTSGQLPGTLIATQANWPVGSGMPCITTISAPGGAVGDSITLEGFYLSGSDTLSITGPATYTSSGFNGSGGSFPFIVPDTLTPGSYNITVTNPNGTSNTVPFTVNAAGTGGGGGGGTGGGGGGTYTAPGAPTITCPAASPKLTPGTAATLTFTAEHADSIVVTSPLNSAIWQNNKTLAGGSLPDSYTYTIYAGPFSSDTYVDFNVSNATTTATCRTSIVYTGVTVTPGDPLKSYGVEAIPGGALSCPANATAIQATDTFDNLASGATSGLGWEADNTYQFLVFAVDGKPTGDEPVSVGRTSASSDAGKTGIGLRMINTENTTGYQGYALITHSVNSATTGTMEFDVRPKQADGTLTVVLGSLGGSISNVYLWYDGTVRAYDAATNNFKQIGTLTYKANDWNHLKISWDGSNLQVAVNGGTTASAPYSYSAGASKPVTHINLIAGFGDDSHTLGTFDVDNITYPSCQGGTDKKPDGGTDAKLTDSGKSPDIICAADETGTQVTTNFDALATGATNDLGWRTIKSANTEIQAVDGKSGKGLGIANTNTGSGFDKYALINHTINHTTSGTLSFDVRPKQTTGSMEVVLGGAAGAVSDIYLWYDGTIRYINTAKGTYDQIGTLTYKANEWNHVTITWDGTKESVAVEGQSAASVPYTYPTATPQPMTYVTVINGWTDGTHLAGSFDIDNITYPGCGTAAKTDNSGSGSAGGSGSGASAAAVKLISSGGSLPVNLGIAALFSLVTTYVLLRRHAI